HSRERPAASRLASSVLVDDDLAACDTGIAVRAANFESTGGIDEIARPDEHVLWEHGLDDLLDHRLGKLLLLFVHARVVLRRQDDGVDTLRFPVDIANGDLRFRVGAQALEPAVAPHFALPLP